MFLYVSLNLAPRGRGGGGRDGVGTPYDGLYGEALPERGTYLFQASGI